MSNRGTITVYPWTERSTMMYDCTEVLAAAGYVMFTQDGNRNAFCGDYLFVADPEPVPPVWFVVMHDDTGRYFLATRTAWESREAAERYARTMSETVGAIVVEASRGVEFNAAGPATGMEDSNDRDAQRRY